MASLAPREERLRVRIDHLVDERDLYRSEYVRMKARRDEAREELYAARRALKEARTSRNMWARRCRDGEASVRRAESLLRRARVAA